MIDKRKIRLRLDLDVLLDQHEYGPDGQTAEETLALIKNQTRSPFKLGRFLEDWGVLEECDFHAEIIE